MFKINLIKYEVIMLIGDFNWSSFYYIVPNFNGKNSNVSVYLYFWLNLSINCCMYKNVQ